MTPVAPMRRRVVHLTAARISEILTNENEQ